MNSLADILSSQHPSEYKQQLSTQTDEKTDAGTIEIIPTQPTTHDSARLEQCKNIIYAMRDQLDALLRLVSGERIASEQMANPDSTILLTGEHIIEGVFNGEKMVGPDGKEYPVPPNYASKSKLVEGDLLKLTITNNGAFIFKQIGPIERKRAVGELVGSDEGGQWKVLSSGRLYNILTASVTFYKGKPGEEVIMLVPDDGESRWGAVENIIHK